jgi:uncharacterized membrane protein
MNETAYRKRLAADLPKWTDAKWLPADGAAAILASLGPERRSTFGLSAILGTLGAVLIGLGVLAFVAANWEAMPRLVRLGLIAAALLVAYAAAWSFDRRNLRVFAEAGLLAAGLVFAAGIALVGQAYHMSGDFAGAVMLFEAGILGGALVTGSPTLTVLGVIGAGYWTWLATYDNHVVPHYPSLIAILIGVLVTTLQNSHYGRIVAIVAFMYWVAMTITGLADQGDWNFAGGMLLFVAAALALWALGAALASLRPSARIAALGEAILWPGLLAVLFTLGILQLAETPLATSDPLVMPAAALIGAAIVLAAAALARRELAAADLVAVAVLGLGALAYAFYVPAGADAELERKLAGGALVLVGCLWAVSLGQSGRHPIGKVFGLAAFGLEIIYLYIFTLGTQIDTALAFLGGGVLFIVLSFVLFRIDRLLARRAAPPAVPPSATPPPAAPPLVVESAPAAEPAKEGGVS